MWKWLFGLMTGCQGKRKMMGRGADGGCGTEEKRCPVARVPARKKPANSPAKVEIDLYSKACKALSERSPFDSEEVRASTVPTLPSGLVSFLSKYSDSRKRVKKSGSDAKSSHKGSTERSKGLNLWVGFEEYFREINLADIERLYQFSTLLESLGSNPCLSIPVIGNADCNDGRVVENENVSDVRDMIVREETELNANKEISGCGDLAVKEGANEEHGQPMEIDKNDREERSPIEEGPGPQPSPSSSSLEWVLGSRNKILLTTQRPSKKRKLLGANAGLEKLVVAQHCEGSTLLCHVCSMGDAGDQLNQLAVCNSCNVAVHQRCYGIQGDVDGSWKCSWCRNKHDAGSKEVLDSGRPCVLCPKPRGALKPVQKAGGGNDGSIEFAHLFCSLWMPEVYIGDMRRMEPICNVEGIKETRGKLLCNLCKTRQGPCVRCSNGSCRTSFHPICAREARQKLEIWGRFGCDDVELRAFCSKHSDSLDGNGTVQQREQNHVQGNVLSAAYGQPAAISAQKPKKIRIACKNGDKLAPQTEKKDATFDNLDAASSQDVEQRNSSSHKKLISEDGHPEESICMETIESNMSEDVKNSDSKDLALILKKLVDRGKVSLKQIAPEIGVSADKLASMVTDNLIVPELQCKILNWLKAHAYMETCQKDLRIKLRRSNSSNDEIFVDDGSDASKDSEMSDVPVKSVPPRRRTVSNIRVVKNAENISLCNDRSNVDGVDMDMDKVQCVSSEGPDNLPSDLNSSRTEKILVESIGYEDSLAEPTSTSQSNLTRPPKYGEPEYREANEDTSCEARPLMVLEHDVSGSSLNAAGHPHQKMKSASGTYVHRYIQNKLKEKQSWVMSEVSSMSAGEDRITLVDGGDACSGVDLEGLDKAKEMGVLDLSPEDEVEGEIVYFQQRLLNNAVVRKRSADRLICKIVTNLPWEIDAARKQRWDDVLVNQYLHELKEARKQGRKERRLMEAQAVLAAATVAAATARSSSLRRDVVDDSLRQENQLNPETSRGRGGLLSQLAPRIKEASSTSAVARTVLDKTDILQFPIGLSKEHPRSCNICGRAENVLNSVLVCSSCKVSVHLYCYRRAKESTGPWYCELCEDNSSYRGSLGTMEKPYPIVECGICGTSTGAFRKSSDGQWVHAFCAEWIFESTFGRGQVKPVEGMETVLKGNDICSVCDRKYGVCLKCYYGHCQTTFHPSCARSAGYYMTSVRCASGKLQHKAFCDKHSVEQRAKADLQKHGVEELKSLKQVRVELEKLRLLCERIVKREKLKRELVLCSQDILASKRDSAACFMLAQSPHLPIEASSESATTSLKGHTDISRSCSDATRKSDDVSIDSRISVRRRIKLPLSMDHDQKTDDSSTSQLLTPKPTNRVSFGGKKIPYRAVMTSRDSVDSAEKRLKSRKHPETFEKELVMTSDQASMKNQRLPKGYIYVPIDCLSNEKQSSGRSTEQRERDA